MRSNALPDGAQYGAAAAPPPENALPVEPPAPVSPAPSARPLPAVRLPVETPGERVAGRYERTHVIAQGRVGPVWAARDTSTGVPVILKRVLTDPGHREVFMQSVQVVASLQHPKIVRILGLYDDEASFVVVSEVVPAKTLAEVLRASGHLGVGEARWILLSLCEALTFAHGRGIVHQNLKPSNIFIPYEGESRISDFHIAGSVRGSGSEDGAGFRAPELAAGTITPAADIYSIGACLEAMLRGGAGLSDMARQVIGRAMNSSVEARFRNPMEFYASVESLPDPI